MSYEVAEQTTGKISLVNTPFWVFIWLLNMVEPTIKLAIVEFMAKEPLLGCPSDEDMIRRPLLELHDALLQLHKVLLGVSVASIRVERDVSFQWVLAAVWVGGKPQDDQQFSLYSSSPHKWPTSHI